MKFGKSQVEEEDGGVLASGELSPPINAGEDVFPYERTGEAGTLALVDSGSDDEDDLLAVPGFMRASCRNAGTFAVIKVERDKGNIHFRLRADIDPGWMVEQQRARQAAIEAAAELERKLAQVAEYERKSFTNQLDRKRPRRRIAATAAKSSASEQQVRLSEDPLKHLKSEVKLIRVGPKSVVKKAAHKIGRMKDKKVVGKRQLKCGSGRGVKFAGKSPRPQTKKQTSAAVLAEKKKRPPVRSPRGKQKLVKKPKIAHVKSPRSPKSGKAAKPRSKGIMQPNKEKEKKSNVSLNKRQKKEPGKPPQITKKEPKANIQEKRTAPPKIKSKIPRVAVEKPMKKNTNTATKLAVPAKKEKTPKQSVHIGKVVPDNTIVEMEKQILSETEIPTIIQDLGDEIVDGQESKLENVCENETEDEELCAAIEPATSSGNYEKGEIASSELEDVQTCPVELTKNLPEDDSNENIGMPESTPEKSVVNATESSANQEPLEPADCEQSITIGEEVVLQVHFASPEPRKSADLPLNDEVQDPRVEDEPVEDETNKFKMCDTCGWVICPFENYKPDPPQKGEEAPPPVEHGECPKCSRDVIKERPAQADCINCRGVFGSATMFELEFDFKSKKSKVICTVCRGPLLIAKTERRVKRVPPQGLRLDIKRYPIMSELFAKWGERYEKNTADGPPLDFDQLFQTIYQKSYTDAPELNVVRQKTSRGQIPPRPKYDCPTTFKLDYKYRGKGEKPEHPKNSFSAF
ncbi:Hypothetical predicted protein [Cloeon dipterum]|uniref:Uncharacterized protein n=1 Tax=Cloeon dipterum TaxID=197152 RepID=A0A8S1DUQ5_9INSE|nr:Hypothetical predicted protein [Cloeon dipterum]